MGDRGVWPPKTYPRPSSPPRPAGMVVRLRGGIREREGERERGAHGSKGGFASLALKSSYLEILIIAIYMQKRLWDRFLRINTYSDFAIKM